MTRLVWRREKPTVPGYYWCRQPDDGKWIVGILELLEGNRVKIGDEVQPLDGREEGCEWAGPLPEPEEA